MRSLKARGMRLTAIAAGALLALSACGGGGSVSDTTKANESKAAAAGGDCGDFNVIVNAWAGYWANAYVVGNVAAEQLGCTVNYLELKEGDPSYQAMASGQADVLLEDWFGSPDDMQAAIDAGDIVNAGETGNVGVIGWYVPGWLAEEHPDVLDFNNLNKYAKEFATSETGGKGQFLGADPTYTQYDESIVKNLGLDFKVIFSGGEAATVEAFKKAQENKEWLIGYFWEPHPLFAEIPMTRVALPPYADGCQDDKAEVACDYPATNLVKLASKKFIDGGSPAAGLVQNFTWTNDDQNTVAKYITVDGMSNEEAAAKWVADNQDKVDAWLQ